MGLSRTKKIALVVGCAGAAAVAAGAAWKVRADQQTQEVEAREARVRRSLDERVRASYEVRAAKGWTRPVLRGEPEERNAAEAQRAPLEALGTVEPAVMDALSLSVRNGTALPPPARALVDGKATTLTALRRAAQGRFSFVRADFEERNPPAFAPGLVATKLLLATTLTEPPAECLRIAADAIRLAQDRMAGALLVPAMLGVATIRVTAPVVLRCGAKLDTAERAEAVRELQLLAEQPPPFGEALEAEWFFMSYGMLTAARASASDGRRVRAVAWNAVERFVAAPPSFDTVTAAGYPAAFATVARFDARWEKTDNPLLAIASGGTLKYVHEDARGQATLRALIVGLELQGEKAIGPRTRAALDSAALRDPFTGAPFRTETLPGGAVRIMSADIDAERRPGAPSENAYVDVAAGE